MEYISTRNKNLNFSFKDVFLRGLAPDGGLFIPKAIKTYNESELQDLRKMSYVDLATEIISNFCSPELESKKLSKLIKKSYKKFLIISKVSLSLVFSAQKSFFIIFTSSELSLNEPLDKRFDIKLDTFLSS